MSVVGELYRLSATALGYLLNETSPPLAFGWVELADGRQVLGYRAHCDQVPQDSIDISAYGSWLAYLKANKDAS